MPKQYTKTSDGQLCMTESKTESRTEIYSYDRILNEIQAASDKLVYWQELKVEADKLNLKR